MSVNYKKKNSEISVQDNKSSMAKISQKDKNQQLRKCSQQMQNAKEGIILYN